MRERTLARLLEIHFGYMKVCTMLSLLSDFEVTVGYILYAIGFSLNEWRTSINTMIEKKGKGNLVKDLKTINLSEVDFNFNNKIMARIIMNCAEVNNLLPKEQCGSRKLHRVSP